MIDYSFLRLKSNLPDALNIDDAPVATHYFYNPIQLLPNKPYFQITNFEGGISLNNDCEVFVVDCNDNILADITDKVFIEEFTDSNGNNQCKIELINLGVDFYRQTVLIKFDMLSSNANFYSNPINITSYQSERTVYFKYKNYDDFEGIGYTNANAWQSISLSMYFDIPIDETETEDYFQISRNNTISARALIKKFELYNIEQINRFTFERLNILLKHELIYMDSVRVTNKPVVGSSERLGDTNYFATDLTVAKNYNDISFYQYQIYGGFNYIDFAPQGILVTGISLAELKFTMTTDVTLQTGTVKVYNDDNTLLETFTEADMTTSGATVLISVIGTSLENPVDDVYYVHISGGLVHSIFNEPNLAVIDDSTWTFNVRAADYSSVDYSTTDYFTN